MLTKDQRIAGVLAIGTLALILLFGQPTLVNSENSYSFPLADSLKVNGKHTLSTLFFDYKNTKGEILMRRGSHWDIVCPADSVVTAPCSGVIVVVDDQDERAGHYIKIEDKEGNIHVLAHFRKRNGIYVIPGQSIQRGQLLGYVGNSGRLTGYHLHWQVYNSKGVAINPRDLVGGSYNVRLPNRR